MACYHCDMCQELRDNDDYPCLQTPAWIPNQQSGLTCCECEWKIEEGEDLLGEE